MGPLKGRTMSAFHRLSLRLWPMFAAVLAVLFIGAGIRAMHHARVLQDRIAHELKLIDALSALNESLHGLGLTHRVATSNGPDHWDHERAALVERVQTLGTTHASAPGMDHFPRAMLLLLHRADSLHTQAMERLHDLEQRALSDAVMQIMLTKARKTAQETGRRVHEEGLAVHAANLNAHWSHARLLLIAACILAAVVAWLAAVRGRLLMKSRLHAAQLERAGQHLEKMNRDLQETMLSKEEKEVMIKEIHHRVKNNLQIVKSLIRFQMDQVSDPRTTELFNECVNRVSAMALVHEQTYLSKDLANIEVDTYLQALIRDLVHAYAVGIDLQMDVDIRVRTLSVDALVPLGLLINEVISNSFKHAFKGRSHGTIIVHLAGSEKEGLVLRIGDDGIGLPDRESWRTPRSLGMELIHTLSGQLDLVLDRTDAPGTLYELRPEAKLLQRRA